MSNRDAGFFLSIEGCEGTGKSTLVEGLFTYLSETQNCQVIKTREPGGTFFGKKVRDLLLNQDIFIDSRAELFLFLADRSHHVETLIKPALRQNQIVICDRFTDSSIAYQGAARNTQDLDLLQLVCNFATSDLQPDLTFYLDLDPEIGLTRIKRDKDRLENENLDFHRRVRRGYLELAHKEPNRIFLLDASQNPKAVLEGAIEKLRKVIKHYHVTSQV